MPNEGNLSASPISAPMIRPKMAKNQPRNNAANNWMQVVLIDEIGQEFVITEKVEEY